MEAACVHLNSRWLTALPQRKPFQALELRTGQVMMQLLAEMVDSSQLQFPMLLFNLLHLFKVEPHVAAF